MFRIYSATLLIAAISTCSGCHRGRYREQADREAVALIAEKVACSVYEVDTYGAWPDARSRYADPYCPDHPPEPCDDPAAARLATDPQPNDCCVGPYEGTAYLELLPLVDVESEPNSADRFLIDPFMAPGEMPRLLGLDNAHQVALLNNRGYQNRRESLYLAALDLSLERGAYASQFFATGKLIYERLGRLLDDGDPATG